MRKGVLETYSDWRLDSGGGGGHTATPRSGNLESTPSSLASPDQGHPVSVSNKGKTSRTAQKEKNKMKRQSRREALLSDM